MSNPRADKILMRAKHSKPEKAKVSFTLDMNTYENFKHWCEQNGVAMSRIIEELMKDIVAK